MKKQIAIFILLILCLTGVDTVNAQLTRKRTEVEEKQLDEKYADRKAVLNYGKYLPNKLINEYLGDWESKDKKIRLNISTRRKKVVDKGTIKPDIDAEFDALIIKVTYLNNKNTIYTDADIGRPMELINIFSDEVYSGTTKDIVKNRKLSIVVRYIGSGKLSAVFTINDHKLKNSQKNPTVFPLTYLGLERTKTPEAEEKERLRVEEMLKRKAELNSGKYFPNKLIADYLGNWESEDKKMRMIIGTKKKKVVRTSFVKSDINAEFDVLVVKITYLNSRDTTYTDAQLGEPIELVNIGSDETYSGLVKDAIKDRSLIMNVRHIDKGRLSVKFNLADRMDKGSPPNPTIFPGMLFNVVRVK